MTTETSIHSLAFVDPKAQLGKGVQVGPFAVIEAGTQIGDGCVIDPHAVVRSHVTLGDGCHVHPTAVIGDVAQDIKFKGGRSYVKIGKGSVFREGVTVHRGTEPESTTLVGDGVFLMASAHIAHNCTVGNRVIIANCSALGGHVTIEDGTFISACTNVHQFCRVGALCMITADIKITHDVPPFALVNGPPRAIAGLNKVGLERAGFKPDTVAAVVQVYETLFKEGPPSEETLRRWGDSPVREVQHIAKFYQGTKRGVMRDFKAGAFD